MTEYLDEIFEGEKKDILQKDVFQLGILQLTPEINLVESIPKSKSICHLDSFLIDETALNKRKVTNCNHSDTNTSDKSMKTSSRHQKSSLRNHRAKTYFRVEVNHCNATISS